MKRKAKIVMALMAGVLVSGCVTNPERHRASWEPVVPPVQPKKIVVNGSIYQASRQESIFSENSSHQVGDLITIQLDDTMTASKTADAAISKDDNAAGGMLDTVALAARGLPSMTGTIAGVGERTFESNGTVNINNNITGTVTVTVMEVFSNGNLSVRGEKRFTINDGDELVRISGVIRVADIQADNSVSSTMLADAQIVYVGDGGMVANANSQGWLSRFFMSAVWPF